MINKKLLTRFFLPLMAVLSLSMLSVSCDDNESYSDLLKKEDRAVNWYLAQQKIVASVPKDSVFEVGPNAPFYRMDSDGNVYMRVLRTGDMNDRPKKGQRVYFRMILTDIIMLSQGASIGNGGNSLDNMAISSSSLIYGNTSLPSTTALGTGIQIPLNYLGYNCEVDLVVKSVVGPSEYISQCVPILYTNLKFFKAEY